MKITMMTCLMGMFCTWVLQSQSGTVIGVISDGNTGKYLHGVTIKIKGTDIEQKSNDDGGFVFQNLAAGIQVMEFFLQGYGIVKRSVLIELGVDLNVGTTILFSLAESEDVATIMLSQEELTEDEFGGSENISGLLRASKDVFLRAAAFSFGQARFKVRGYDARNGTVLMNGVRMNKMYDGRPQWSDWGGLNDALRNQRFSNGLDPSEDSFGGILGTTNFVTRASSFRKGTKISVASSNGSYLGRLMGIYATGQMKNGWTLVVSGSRRFAHEGYSEGSFYNAWSAFLSAEKRINDSHSLNLTAMMTPNRRGKSSPNTPEVYGYKGHKYNAYWGMYGNRKRNSRIKEVAEPLFIMSHYWKISESTSLQNNLSFQTGHISNSRLGYFKAPNPDPVYYKYLPSYSISQGQNYAKAHMALLNFQSMGQINWRQMYDVNSILGNSLYYMYDDRVDDTRMQFNSILRKNINERFSLNSSVSFEKLNSENFAVMTDLLGGDYFTDLNPFATGIHMQSDLNNPDRDVKKGEKFNYHYNIEASRLDLFSQLEMSLPKVDGYFSAQYSMTTYNRDGKFKNGLYPENSFGKGKQLSFSDLSLKGGFHYKFTGRHIVGLNAGYISEAPIIKNLYVNARLSHELSPNISSEYSLAGDLSYYYRDPVFKGRLTAYYTLFNNLHKTSYFFADGLRGDDADFVAQVISGLQQRHLGIELGLKAQVMSELAFTGVMALGEYTYGNNPQLDIRSDSFDAEQGDFGISYLQDYRVGGMPQRAYSIGFEYNDPDYWWLSANANLLTHHFIGIAPLLRTSNFYKDSDGIPFIDEETGVQVSSKEVNSLLSQEQFQNTFLINLVGGKSWRLEESTIGFFMSVNNLLGASYKSGGFEQSRNANYRELKKDKELEIPVFGSKYWFGNKTTYYMNLYVRF